MFAASDEAFAVWMCLNHCERWFDMHDKSNWKDSEVQAKWTNSGKSKKDGRSKKFMGASKEGMQRFNSLLSEVRKQQKNKDTDDFDTKFMDAAKEELEKEKNKGKAGPKENDTWADTDFDWDKDGEDSETECSNSETAVHSLQCG